MKIIKFKDFFIRSISVTFPDMSLVSNCHPKGCGVCCFKGFCLRTSYLFTLVKLAK